MNVFSVSYLRGAQGIHVLGQTFDHKDCVEITSETHLLIIMLRAAIHSVRLREGPPVQIEKMLRWQRPGVT